MKSDKSVIADARSMVAALSGQITALNSLDGARNSSASFDEACEALEVVDGLRGALLLLRTRYSDRSQRKLDKKPVTP